MSVSALDRKRIDDGMVGVDFQVFLLEHLARNVERQILKVDDALDEDEVLREAVVYDEAAADVPR